MLAIIITFLCQYTHFNNLLCNICNIIINLNQSIINKS